MNNMPTQLLFLYMNTSLCVGSTVKLYIGVVFHSNAMEWYDRSVNIVPALVGRIAPQNLHHTK